MAYDEKLAARIRKLLQAKKLQFAEKVMFGGLTFMINGNMALGIARGKYLMARVGKDQYEKALARPHTRPMDFTKKPMAGFVFVDPEGLKNDSDLSFWIDMSLTYNKTLPKK